MILKQYYLGCLAHAPYLIGDPETRTAAVVDPQRDIDQYLQDAARLGRIGFDQVAGYLGGGILAWEASRLKTAASAA